ncbi:XRE family transcriptional regulator [Actinoplanes missouriensis]|uniref:XRE family transcriptional regulator n=1 Tax=Actinoplanes missouriensis TaxID=1866 RepID=UPI0033D70008
MIRRVWIAIFVLAVTSLAIVAYRGINLELETADRVASVVSGLVALISLAVTLRSRRIVHPKAMETSVEQPESWPADPAVRREWEDWRTTRLRLNDWRAVLARAVAGLYDPSYRIGDTGLIASPAWRLAEPLALDSVALVIDENVRRPSITGQRGQADLALPRSSSVEWFHRYSSVLKEIDRPKHLDNRRSWRLLDVVLSDSPYASFGTATYFEALDVCESVAHEAARIFNVEGSSGIRADMALSDLPLRCLIDDPFDLRQRVAIPAISTLVIRNDRRCPTCILHWRDPKKVAIAGNTHQAIPSGAFQPSSQSAQAEQVDFDLWRNIMREYAEELLGRIDNDGDGPPADYSTHPFRQLDAAKADGRIRVYLLGFALDALTLWSEILTVVVLEPDIFDELTPRLAEIGTHTLPQNQEGVKVKVIPFDKGAVKRMLREGTVAPAGAGCLSLAMKHRTMLLGHGPHRPKTGRPGA